MCDGLKNFLYSFPQDYSSYKRGYEMNYCYENIQFKGWIMKFLFTVLYISFSLFQMHDGG